MSDVLVLVAGGLLAVGYLAAGVMTAIVYDVATTDGADGCREAAEIVATWPVIVFTVLGGLYALWATQRVLDKL